MKKLLCIILFLLQSSFVLSSEVSNEKYNFATLDINQDGILSEAEYNLSRIGMTESEILKRTIRFTTHSTEFSAFEPQEDPVPDEPQATTDIWDDDW